MSLHQAVSLCMDHCDAAGLTGDDSWFKTVVLTGGSACLPGLSGSITISVFLLQMPSIYSEIREWRAYGFCFILCDLYPERLERELQDHLPSSISNGIRVIPPPYGVDTSWHGAKLISNLSIFPGPWCITRKQFRRKSRLMW
jgi:actin-related protein 8